MFDYYVVKVCLSFKGLIICAQCIRGALEVKCHHLFLIIFRALELPYYKPHSSVLID